MDFPSFLSLSRFDATIFIFFSLSVLTTGLRIYSRACVLRALGLDDILAFVAILFGGLLSIFQHFKISSNRDLYQLSVRAGNVVSTTDQAYHHRNWGARWGLLEELTHAVELALIKCAILAFYRRVAVQRKHFYMLYWLGGVIMTWTIIFVLIRCLGTSPRAAVWTPLSRTYTAKIHCSCEVLAIVQSSLQATFDIIILCIPIPIFLTLKLGPGKKVGLVCIYALSLLSFSTTVIRLVQSIRFLMGKQGTVGFLERRAEIVVFTIWTSLEANTALICANLPALWALWRRASVSVSVRETKPSLGMGGSDEEISLSRRGRVRSGESWMRWSGSGGGSRR